MCYNIIIKQGGNIMSENKFDAKVDQIKGSVKETAGKLTGDKETETNGALEKTAGKVKEAFEDAGDVVKGAVEKVKEAVNKEK